MLFYVQADMIGGYPLPPEQWLGLVAQQLELILELKIQGKIVIHGSFVGRQAGCFIWNVDSNEELQSLLTQMPLWPFMDWDIVPMISTEAAMDSVRQSVAEMAAEKE